MVVCFLQYMLIFFINLYCQIISIVILKFSGNLKFETKPRKPTDRQSIFKIDIFLYRKFIDNRNSYG